MPAERSLRGKSVVMRDSAQVRERAPGLIALLQAKWMQRSYFDFRIIQALSIKRRISSEEKPQKSSPQPNGTISHGTSSREDHMRSGKLSAGGLFLGEITPDELQKNDELRAKASKLSRAVPANAAPQPRGEQMGPEELGHALGAKIIGRTSTGTI